MAKYGFRNNALSMKTVTSENISGQYIEAVKNETETAPFIKIQAINGAGKNYYLFIGTAGVLCLSSTAPAEKVGTAAVANKGFKLGTAA